ncbi:MAG: fumarylacetoacetate hydrolase family protein [Vicinamibacteria bacterium]|nr:fumarylacetoacetate hydrolase family protein [Vicinamibacteria bacterium]
MNRYYRVRDRGAAVWAREEGDRLRLLEGNPFQSPRERGETIEKAGAHLVCPLHPSKIVAIGRNYKDHAAERGKPVPKEPLVFLKPPSSLIGPGQPIRHPGWVGRVDHEAELGLVIGREVSRPPTPQEAAAAIFGAVCVNDVTAREIQDKDVQFTRGKGFDTFCPVGPCVATGLDLGALQVEARVNGSIRQRGNTRDLIFDPAYLVWYVARVMTLLPGDIISTGTPAGVGPLQPGDVVEVEVEGVGVLRNPVQSQEGPQ